MSRHRTVSQGWIEGTGWFAVPVIVFEDTRLLTTDQVVLAYLCYVAGGDGAAWPARSRIVARTGVSRRTVDRVIGRLLQYGWLRHVGRVKPPKDTPGGRPRHVYRLCIPRAYPTRAGVGFHATVTQTSGGYPPRRGGVSRHGGGGSTCSKSKSEVTKSEIGDPVAEPDYDQLRTPDQWLDEMGKIVGHHRRHCGPDA